MPPEIDSFQFGVAFGEVSTLIREILASAEPGQGLEGWTEAKLQATVQSGGRLAACGNGAGFDAVALLVPLLSAYEILFLGSRPARRRSGLMEALLTHLNETLPLGKSFWLEVHENNVAARNLYKKVGFVEVGLRPHYYRDGGAAVTLSLQR